MKSLLRRALGFAPPASPWDVDEVLREELFSIERLEQHALSLAVAQPITDKPARRPPLSARLSDNEAVLLKAYRAIAQAVAQGRAITPAAEWLLDNYHLVEAQIREIREDLPPGFYRQLPKLAERTLRRLSAGIRHRLGLRRTYGQPLRPRDAASIRPRLPDRAAPDDRRAVGRRHHAAHRARRESAPRGASHRHQSRRARRRPMTLRIVCWALNGHPRQPDALKRSHDTRLTTGTRVRRPARAAPARPGPARSCRP